MNGKAKKNKWYVWFHCYSHVVLAGLPPTFWCYTLEHAVYVKTCLFHQPINWIPCTCLFKHKVSLSHLCTFGTCIVSCMSGKHCAKLDAHAYEGIFIGHAATSSCWFHKSWAPQDASIHGLMAYCILYTNTDAIQTSTLATSLNPLV